MAGRKARQSIEAKLHELHCAAEEAEEVQRIVEAREPRVHDLVARARRIREENHFTELFLSTVGGHRRR